MAQSVAKPIVQNTQVVRETIESLAVAFVLALMFKAFIAEAFVIPTGSMAPTLMGAHKDVRCEECGFDYQCGASSEYTDTGVKNDHFVYGTICPLCRKPQVLDLGKNANHATFTGDRILVSKLAYTFFNPQRWQVIVFKHLEEARLNYIKRCIGRPNETIRINHGDIYIRDDKAAGSDKGPAKFAIARKPPKVINAMLQPLSDTRYVPKKLVAAGVPDAWQNDPRNIGNRWTSGYSNNQWKATVTGVSSGTESRIRYYHRVIDPIQWDHLDENGTLPKPILPTSYRLINDFAAYNASMVYRSKNRDEKQVPESLLEQARKSTTKEIRFSFIQDGSKSHPIENDGIHWTGDLAAEWDIKTESSTEKLRLTLVEAGVENICEINLANGAATAVIEVNGKSIEGFVLSDGSFTSEIQATTSVRAGARHILRYANVDDTLVLWVDGYPVKWSNGGAYDLLRKIPLSNHYPQTSSSNPLDAAPVALGVVGGGAEISRAKVFRDIYYIAQAGRSNWDYGQLFPVLQESARPEAKAAYLQQNYDLTEKQFTEISSTQALERNAIFSDASLWKDSPMAIQRGPVEFPNQDDWYFPMGDNSSASHDARSWNEHHVPHRLFIGRAVMVFWPHYWNSPIPFLPNFQRMGLIR